MEHILKETGCWIKRKEEDILLFRMEENIMENGEMIQCVVKDRSLIKMEINMMDNLAIIFLMGLVDMNSRMVMSTRDNSRRVDHMAEENTPTLME